MELNMQYIYQVYQDGSFTKAAEKLFLTQPALSMAVRQEEKILGAALFDRSRRPLALTPAVPSASPAPSAASPASSLPTEPYPGTGSLPMALLWTR